MKELNIPFSLFDFFAVLLPGAAGFFGLYLFINPSLTMDGHDAVFSQLALQALSSELALFTGFVLVSYLLGQVFNAISELLIDKQANRLFGAHMVKDINHYNVQQAIQKRFGNDIMKQSVRRTFIMVEATIGIKMPDAAAAAGRFIALAVMFQSLMLTMAIIGLALLRGYLIGQIFINALDTLVLAEFFMLVLILLLFWSYRRYKRMWSQTVFMSFVTYIVLDEADKQAQEYKSTSG